MEKINTAETKENLKIVEKELLEKHQEWTQAKARWMSQKLLCLT